jgi:hypothetical protein
MRRPFVPCVPEHAVPSRPSGTDAAERTEAREPRLQLLFGHALSHLLSDVFGVDERSVTRARSELVSLGWLVPEERGQWYLNRFGWRYQIDLGWERGAVAETAGVERLPDLVPVSPLVLPAPLDREPFPREGSSNQKPGTDRPGVSITKGKDIPPSMNDVKQADLSETSRLLTLFTDATGLGFVNGSEASRLQFVALAEHARSIGSHNPPGLFAHLVRKNLWHFATADDEEGARARIRRHEFGPSLPAASVPTSVSSLVGSLVSRLVPHPTMKVPSGPSASEGRGEPAARADG